MNKAIFIFSVFAVSACSCSRKETVVFPETKRLTAEKIPLMDIVKPALLTLADGMMVMSCQESDSALYFYSTPDLQHIAAVGIFGQGPDDFAFTPFFCENVSAPAKGLTVKNFGGFNVIRSIDTDSIDKISVTKEFRLKNFDDIFRTYIKNDSIIVYLHSEEKTVKKFDMAKNEFIGSIAIGQEPNTGSFDPDTGTIVCNDSTIIYAYCYKDRLDFYDFETMKLRKSIVGPGETYIGDPYSNTNNSKLYYSGVYSGKRYFYTYNDFNAKRTGECKLQVFDYDGNPVVEYTFDIIPANPMVVDEENGYIYSFNYRHEDYLLRYKL